jgi:hypothetical protein
MLALCALAAGLKAADELPARYFELMEAGSVRHPATTT